MNARITNELDNDGLRISGKYCFDREHEDTTLEENMISNRDQLLDLCNSEGLIISNTFSKNQTANFAHTKGPEIDRNKKKRKENNNATQTRQIQLLRR